MASDSEVRRPRWTELGEKWVVSGVDGRRWREFGPGGPAMAERGPPPRGGSPWPTAWAPLPAALVGRGRSPAGEGTGHARPLRLPWGPPPRGRRPPAGASGGHHLPGAGQGGAGGGPARFFLPAAAGLSSGPEAGPGLRGGESLLILSAPGRRPAIFRAEPPPPTPHRGGARRAGEGRRSSWRRSCPQRERQPAGPGPLWSPLAPPRVKSPSNPPPLAHSAWRALGSRRAFESPGGDGAAAGASPRPAPGPRRRGRGLAPMPWPMPWAMGWAMAPGPSRLSSICSSSRTQKYEPPPPPPPGSEADPSLQIFKN